MPTPPEVALLRASGPNAAGSASTAGAHLHASPPSTAMAPAYARHAASGPELAVGEPPRPPDLDGCADPTSEDDGSGNVPQQSSPNQHTTISRAPSAQRDRAPLAVPLLPAPSTEVLQAPPLPAVPRPRLARHVRLPLFTDQDSRPTAPPPPSRLADRLAGIVSRAVPPPHRRPVRRYATARVARSARVSCDMAFYGTYPCAVGVFECFSTVSTRGE